MAKRSSGKHGLKIGWSMKGRLLIAPNGGECFAGSWFSGLPLLFQTRLEVNDSADDVDHETQGSSQPGGGGFIQDYVL